MAVIITKGVEPQLHWRVLNWRALILSPGSHKLKDYKDSLLAHLASRALREGWKWWSQLGMERGVLCLDAACVCSAVPWTRARGRHTFIRAQQARTFRPPEISELSLLIQPWNQLKKTSEVTAAGPVAQGATHLQVEWVSGGKLHLNYLLKWMREQNGSGKKFRFGHHFSAKHGAQYLLLPHLDLSSNGFKPC